MPVTRSRTKMSDASLRSFGTRLEAHEEKATNRPSADREGHELFDVRTPAEIDVAPDAATIAFSLHASVSERGVSVPSDLWMIRSDGAQVRLTDGEWADRSPVWSPDGSRLAFLSDRRTSGHRLP